MKQVNWKVKYQYVKRYMQGERLCLLSLELLRKKLTKDKIAKYCILRWNKVYKQRGLKGLQGLDNKKRGRKPKNKKKNDWSQYTREELEIILEIYEDLIKKQTKQKFIAIEKYKHLLSKTKLCKILKVSKSGYYKWISNGKQQEANYDLKLLNKIKYLFYLKKERFGFKRIKILLEKEFSIYRNIKTINRYMKKLNLKSKIRQKKKTREIKNTKASFINLINRDFKTSKLNQKLFTDVSYIKTTNGWRYLSIIIDSYNNEIISYEFGMHNSCQLILKTFKKAFNKIKNQNGIIHSDHGFQYSNGEVMDLVNKFNWKQSMSRIGNSLDNRPAEYFFSVLKQEYLFEKPKNFKETKKDIKNAIWDYNNIRFQSCIKNMSPVEYRTHI